MNVEQDKDIMDIQIDEEEKINNEDVEVEIEKLKKRNFISRFFIGS